MARLFPHALLPGRELQYAIVRIACSGMLQRFSNGLFQCLQLERLSQYPKLRCGRWRCIAVTAGEQNWKPWIAVPDFLRQGNAIHPAWHDDVAENKYYFVAALQPAQSIHGIVCAHDPVTELLQE